MEASKTTLHTSAEITENVMSRPLAGGYHRSMSPSVESVQDMVETALIDMGCAEAAKAYILYRSEHKRLREEKCRTLNTDTLDEVSKDFDSNSLRVLAARYLVKDGHGNIIESPSELFQRVSTLVGIGDMVRELSDGGESNANEALAYLEKLEDIGGMVGGGSVKLNPHHMRALIMLYVELASRGQVKVRFGDLVKTLASGLECPTADEYYELMTKRVFMPNSPTLMNAGTSIGQLSACFVLGMDDTLDSIMDTNANAAKIFQSGGGVGINYSNLRHSGDMVASTSGVASGPVSFMNITNTITDVVKQGGKRRGANMGIMEVWHPDIEAFVMEKTKPGSLENFNISVGIWDDFWAAATRDGGGTFELRSPRTGEVVKKINAKSLLDMIATSAWKGAEPGLVFFDTINKRNVLGPARGQPIRATNPCGEQALYPYESCNLGSINLAMLATKLGGRYEFDWQEYERVIRLCTRFLDNIIDVNRYPFRQIDMASKETRRIGLWCHGRGRPPVHDAHTVQLAGRV